MQTLAFVNDAIAALDADRSGGGQNQQQAHGHGHSHHGAGGAGTMAAAAAAAATADLGLPLCESCDHLKFLFQSAMQAVLALQFVFMSREPDDDIVAAAVGAGALEALSGFLRLAVHRPTSGTQTVCGWAVGCLGNCTARAKVRRAQEEQTHSRR